MAHAEREVLRRPWQIAFGMLLLVFGELVYLAVIVSMAVNSPPFWAGIVPFAVVAVVMALGMIRQLRLAVVMDDSGVTVRNYFRTFRIIWSEIAGVTVRRAFTPVVRLNLVDGRHIRCTAVGGIMRVYSRRTLDFLVGRMQVRLAEAQGQMPPLR